MIAGFKHEQTYNYDASGTKLIDTRIGVKYYCTSDGVEKDMKKRIVHVYDTKAPTN